MTERYWTMFYLLWAAILALSIISAIVIVLFRKKILTIRYMSSAISISLIFVLLCVYLLIPYVKDLHLVTQNTYIEDIAEVVEFTEVHRDLDGNGQIAYSEPKFYIPDKNQYIILYVANVEVGKTYRIRYYPNTRICEIAECIG